jgi:hypothetical protein
VITEDSFKQFGGIEKYGTKQIQPTSDQISA